MKISMEWLQEYVEIRESPEKLKEDLSMIGLLVEAITEIHGTSVLDIEVTSNRPDCLSHIGIAREVAALYHRPLRRPPVCGQLTLSSEKIPFSIDIRDADLCPRYAGLVLDGITVQPSPVWMQRRLEAAGMRPLNNIVDITNYVLLEMGHPLHAFDFDILRRNSIVVARAKPGQRFQTLDGVERELDGEMLMINDGGGPSAIAGVMGGLNSEISQKTTRVLLESAYFNPASIRRTSRRLGLSTEASYRFERGADWENAVPSIARAGLLIQQLAGGCVAGSLQDVYPVKKEPVRILLRQKNADALLGVEMPAEFIESTLGRLEFKLKANGDGAWDVECPTYRADMELEADLIEELARFFGYQNIPATLPPSSRVGIPSPVYNLENAIRDILRGLGYSEAVNLSFANENDWEDFSSCELERIAVRNPLTEDTQFMRTTLAPGLVRCAKRNFNFGRRLVRLFEIGKIYYRGPDGVPIERNALGILGTGGFTEQNWKFPAANYDFFHMKGVVETVMQGLRIRSFDVETTVAGWLNPEEAAILKAGDQVVGTLGALCSALEEKYKLKQSVYFAELDLEGIASAAFSAVTCEPLPKYPSAVRDLSIVASQDLAYQTIHKGITGLGIPELLHIDLIDAYQGDKIPAGKVSLTLRLTFLDREKTLTVDRVQSFIETIFSYINNTYGVELRSL